MKEISANYVSDILSSRRFAMAELYEFTLTDSSGTSSTDYYTSADFDIFHDGNTYKSKSLIIEGLRYRNSIGWTVDEQEVRISAYSSYTLAGSEFFQAVVAGLLDGAWITRKRAFWTAVNNIGQLDFAAAPTDVITLFTGRVSTLEHVGRTTVEMKVKSPLSLLDLDMPRNTYQPGCQWDLFDSGCTLARASFTVSGTVAAANVGAIEFQGGVPSPTGADGDPTFMMGRLKFTSGARQNLTISLRTNDSSFLYFLFPPVTGIAVGDTFECWPGCSKREDTCELKYNNLSNFRGFPRVPPIMVSA